MNNIIYLVGLVVVILADPRRSSVLRSTMKGIGSHAEREAP